MRVVGIIPSAITAGELAALLEWACNRHVVECGSQFGYSTVQLAGVVARPLWSIDWHEGDANAGYQWSGGEYLRNTYKSRHHIVSIWGRFEEVLPGLAGPFDLAFLDGAHDASSVARDLGLLERLTRRVICHDHGRFGVAAGIDRAGWRVVEKAETMALCERIG